MFAEKTKHHPEWSNVSQHYQPYELCCCHKVAKINSDKLMK